MTVDEAVESFFALARAGAPPDMEAFLAEHPEQADELRELLPVLLEMETYGRNLRSDGHVESTEPPDLSGTDYQIVRLLGRGGMGTVWEARQISLNRTVAVKTFRPPIRNGDVWRERFVRESRIVAQLHHPNIVKVYGAGTRGDLCYYAMELVDGTGFDVFAFSDVQAVVRAVRQAALALAYAHRCGVAHLDVKPSNLMFDAAGEVRVTDFGLAIMLSDPSVKEEAAVGGTLRYMAPERLGKKGATTVAVDQYALGVTLRELLERKGMSGVDVDLKAVVARASAADPACRYRDMSAFADDLRRWLNHESVFALPPSLYRRLCLWARRRPAVAVWTGIAALCALAFAGALAGGYVKTAAALRLADRNAALADAALNDVFRHVEGDAPSRRDAELLSALMPYYAQLAGERGLDAEKSAEANAVLGVCALRSGDVALAEKAFRRLSELKPSAFALNRLSETLSRQGRNDEAGAISEQVVARFTDSTVARERYEAALALERLGHQNGRFAERKRAFALAQTLLASDPSDPDYRFLSARLLAESPRLATEDRRAAPETRKNAFSLLRDLAADYPDRIEYGCALLTALTRRLRGGRTSSVETADLELALETADRLLGRHPNVPEVASTVVAFRDTYANHLRRQGNVAEANRERMRTAGMLELLSHNAESPEATRHVFKGRTSDVLYRQIVLGAEADGDEQTALVLALHDRPRSGSCNVRQMTMPMLRTLTSYAQAHGGRVVILVPQCPGGRENAWAGTKKRPEDGLLDDVAALVRAKKDEFHVPPSRTFVAGVEVGGDACWPLLTHHPDLFARALVAGARPMPETLQQKVSTDIRVCLGLNHKAVVESAFPDADWDWLFGD